MLKSFKSIQFKFLAMHDCRLGKCHPSVLHHQMQERQETSHTVSLISHEDDGCFVINMHALHNATLLWNILPHHLTALKHLYTDRIAQHHEVAAQLHVTQVEKHAHTAVKSKATREANKAKKQNRQTVVAEESALDSGSDSDGHPDRSLGEYRDEGQVQEHTINKRQ